MGGNQLEKVAGVVEEDDRVRDDRQEPHTLSWWSMVKGCGGVVGLVKGCDGGVEMIK